MAKFKAVVVPPDEVHIVNTGKGQFIHTSLKNPKYWLTPWKKVYKIPLKAIPIRVSVPVSHTGNLQIILEMEIVFKLRDPELAVKSLGGNIDQLKNTVEGTIKASTRQAALKYPIENILDFYSNVTKEGRASVEGLVRELGFDIISFDIMNIHKKKDLAEEPPVPTSGYYGDNGDNVYGVPSETMPVIPPPVGGAACGDNGGMITNPNVPMLPVGGSGENPATPPAQYSTPPFPLAQPGEMPDYREQIQEESTPNFVNPSSLETDQRRTDWQYNQQRNVAINSAFENFQYSRDDLKWSENQQGMNVPAQESNHAAMNVSAQESNHAAMNDGGN